MFNLHFTDCLIRKLENEENYSLMLLTYQICSLTSAISLLCQTHLSTGCTLNNKYPLPMTMEKKKAQYILQPSTRLM
jgi:hypothetical protein